MLHVVRYASRHRHRRAVHVQSNGDRNEFLHSINLEHERSPERRGMGVNVNNALPETAPNCTASPLHLSPSMLMMIPPFSFSSRITLCLAPFQSSKNASNAWMMTSQNLQPPSCGILVLDKVNASMTRLRLAMASLPSKYTLFG